MTLLITDTLPIQSCLGNQLFVEKNWVYDVQYILPYFEVSHDCHLLHLNLQNFFVRIENNGQSFPFSLLVRRHKGIMPQILSVCIGTATITDSK